MTNEKRDAPRGQPGAPSQAPRTATGEDPASREAERRPPEVPVGDAVHGDRMPKGADEPGAGL